MKRGKGVTFSTPKKPCTPEKTGEQKESATRDGGDSRIEKESFGRKRKGKPGHSVVPERGGTCRDRKGKNSKEPCHR